MTGRKKQDRPKGQVDAKGAFEAFRTNWLLQVAADRGAKSATPIAIVLACKYLNRASGCSWPGVETLAARTGAEASNTVRNALKLLEARGHALVTWTKGGKGKTHVVTPLVAGKPFKNLKGKDEHEPFNSMEGFDDAGEADFRAETLQKGDGKPFKNLKGNHLKEPFKEPVERAHGPLGASAPTLDAVNSPWNDPGSIRDDDKRAPSAAPGGAPGASSNHDEGSYWPSEFVLFQKFDDPAAFIEDHDPDLLIRAEPEAWRKLIKWIGRKYDDDAVKEATERMHAKALTIATIKGFRRRAADVA